MGRACGDDAGLLRQVETLLANDASSVATRDGKRFLVRVAQEQKLAMTSLSDSVAAEYGSWNSRVRYSVIWN
jgi:hypothetical protein